MIVDIQTWTSTAVLDCLVLFWIMTWHSDIRANQWDSFSFLDVWRDNSARRSELSLQDTWGADRAVITGLQAGDHDLFVTLVLLESGNAYILMTEEEQTARTALKPTCGWVISSESYIRCVSVKSNMVNCVLSDVVLQPYQRGPLSGRVRTVAKSAYWLRQVRPSVRPLYQHAFRWMDFPWNSILGTFIENCLENPNLVKFGQKYRALYVT